MAWWSARTLGSTSSRTARTAATCIAVGNVSLEDCPMFTWSFGCTGTLLPITPPASWIARLAITSLTFMFVCVPDPVCQTRSGKCSSSSPSITSSATRAMRSASQAGRRPAVPFASAAAFFT